MTSTKKSGLSHEESETFLKQDGGQAKEEVKNDDKPRFIIKLRQNKEFRDKFIHTIIIWWSFITMGWATGMGGPSFPDLRQIVQKDLGTASWIFTAGAAGYVTGSLVFGVLYDKLNKLLLLAFTTFWFAICQGAKPWCSLFAVMIVVNYLTGAFCGGLDTGANADIPYIWGVEAGPYMQALHMCFCLGAILSPLATEPFLSEKICEDMNKTENTSDVPLSVQMEVQNTTHEPNDRCIEAYGETMVHYAFLISAILILTATLGYLFLYCKMSHVHAKLAEQKENMAAQNDSKKKQMSLKVKTIVLILLALLMMSYCVTEDGFGSFLMTFSIDHLKWSKETGSYATTVFWACFVTGRFCGIFIVSCCSQSTMLTTYLCSIAISSVGFLLGSVFSIIPLIWIFTGALGFSMSVVFPCIFGWTSENILTISGKISSVFLVSAGLGAMLFPLLVGYLMSFSPLWYAYMMVIFAVITLSIYLSVRLVTYFYVINEDVDSEVEEYKKEMTVLKSEDVKIDKNDKLYPLLR